MKIISHRGGLAVNPENSLKAINYSKEIGVDYIEFDVRVTKDNKLVVFHDKSLKRLAGVNYLIKDLTLDELKKITLKSGETIPTLEELLKTAGNTPLMLEGKGPGWATLVTEELKNYKHKDTLIVISFNNEELYKYEKLNPGISLYAVSIIRGFRALKRALENNYEGISLFYPAMNPILYRKALKANKKIYVYTFKSTWLANLYAKIYPKIDIATDNPLPLMGARNK